MLTGLTLALGEGSGHWVSSSLINITSVQFSAALPTDAVQLCGSNDNTATISSPLSILTLTGGATLQNMGVTTQKLGAFLYYALLRIQGATPGLRVVLAGDDGT